MNKKSVQLILKTILSEEGELRVAVNTDIWKNTPELWGIVPADITRAIIDVYTSRGKDAGSTLQTIISELNRSLEEDK